MRAFAKKLIYSLPLFGRRRWQVFFEGLESVCLFGMNVGAGSHFETSGERSVLNYIKRKEGQSPLVIFDVGANVGDYAQLLSETFGCESLVFAFEPSRVTFRKLTENVGTNPYIRLHNFGFSNQEETVTFFSDREGSGLSSVYKRRLDHFGTSLDRKEVGRLETLDGFCERSNIRQIDYLKLDVEGHELKVLEGARSLLQRRAIKYIQFEFGGCNIDSRTFFQDFYYSLKDIFSLYRVVRNGLYPIKEYNERLERFVTTNFFGEVKK